MDVYMPLDTNTMDTGCYGPRSPKLEFSHRERNRIVLCVEASRCVKTTNVALQRLHKNCIDQSECSISDYDQKQKCLLNFYLVHVIWDIESEFLYTSQDQYKSSILSQKMAWTIFVSAYLLCYSSFPILDWVPDSHF